VKPATQKALGWIGLAVAGSGILVFSWLSIIEMRWPAQEESAIWFLPGGTVPLAALCVWVLWRAYRLEPVPGRTQLALADVLSSLIVLGSVLYVGSHAQEGMELLQYWGVPALVISGCYLAGITRAARLGLLSWQRYTVGTATALTILGCLGVGALIVMLVFTGFALGVDVCAQLALNIFYIGTGDDWGIYALRVSLCALPIGLLMGLVLRLTMSLPNRPEQDR